MNQTTHDFLSWRANAEPNSVYAYKFCNRYYRHNEPDAVCLISQQHLFRNEIQFSTYAMRYRKLLRRIEDNNLIEAESSSDEYTIQAHSRVSQWGIRTKQKIASLTWCVASGFKFFAVQHQHVNSYEIARIFVFSTLNSARSVEPYIKCDNYFGDIEAAWCPRSVLYGNTLHTKRKIREGIDSKFKCYNTFAKYFTDLIEILWRIERQLYTFQ